MFTWKQSFPNCLSFSTTFYQEKQGHAQTINCMHLQNKLKLTTKFFVFVFLNNKKKRNYVEVVCDIIPQQHSDLA